MKKSALYAINDGGNTSAFACGYGGAYHIPFIALDGAEKLLEKNKLLNSVSDAFPLLQFNHLYDCNQNLNGEFVFDEIYGCNLSEYLSDFDKTDTYNMLISIDIDEGTISFNHNPLCYEQAPPDFSISISDGICCYEETVDEAANEGKFLPIVIESKMEQKLAESLEQQNNLAPQINLG